jgi:hypothetical protein
MLSDKLKLALLSQKNEAVDSLVNGNLEDLASARYLQGSIHRIDSTLLLIKQLEGTEDDE